MHSKRCGRVQVNMMQFYELVERVDKLEAQNKPKEVEQKAPDKDASPVLTKKTIMEELDALGIKYSDRSTKAVLQALLEENKEVETCQEDQTDLD